MSEVIAQLLEVGASYVKAFDAFDSFNENQIEGFICRKSDHRYGAVVITRVNGRATPLQLVWCTPKLKYPFHRQLGGDGSRRYDIPEALEVEVYEKLDGTNICQFSYADADGERFVTYKTRLSPVLAKQKYGDFLALWRRAMDLDPSIAAMEDRVRSGELTVSYELFGARNPILVRYAEPVASRLLFAVGQSDGAVLPASQFGIEPVARCGRDDDPVDLYQRMRAHAQSISKMVEAPEGEYLDGIEGYVFYVRCVEDGRWVMFKAKSELVEEIHWASGAIPESVILPTVWNALESCDELTSAYVRELLAEEFDETAIQVSARRIERCVATVIEQIEFRAQVLEVYESSGLDWQRDGRGTVMRHVAGALLPEGVGKSERSLRSRMAYSALVQLGVAA